MNAVSQEQAITVTEKAAAFIQRILQNKANALGIRLSVKEAGCTGMSYIVNVAEEIKSDDLVFENVNVKVIVDPKSFPVLQGTEIDLRNVGLREELQFNNPNVDSQCGCGESFNIRPVGGQAPKEGKY